MQDAAAGLAAARVFAALSPRARDALAAAGRPVELQPGAVLCQAGDASDAAYVILTGEIEVTRATPDGRDVFLASLGPGAVAGEMGVLDGGPRSADMRAVRRTSLLRIGRDTILKTLRDEPEAALQLLADLTGRLRATDAALQEMALQGLGPRLARLLLQGGGAVVSTSQGDMARQIGASRERVNRKLAEWREQGWVELGAFGVRLADRAALQGLLAASTGL